jgi:hypothetical protein
MPPSSAAGPDAMAFLLVLVGMRPYRSCHPDCWSSAAVVCWSSAAVAGQRLRPDGRTFEKLAIEESVPRRHVNNLVRRAELRVREGLATSSAPLPWVVSTLRTRLGTAATQRQVASARRHKAGTRFRPTRVCQRSSRKRRAWAMVCILSIGT